MQASTKDEFSFLYGAGEMGEMIRGYDWSQSAIGIPELWPQSLRTTLSIILHSKFPMFLFWGNDLVSFYNDAFRPSLGAEGKHPSALGKPGREVWPEIWDYIFPMIDQVMTTGEPTWQEDQLVPFYRNGKMEDIYWTFSYSPVMDESDKPGGVFVTCVETTRQVTFRDQLQLSDQRFRNLIRDASVGLILLMGEEMKITLVNEAYGKLIGRTVEDMTDQYLFDLIPELREEFYPLLLNVLRTGEPLYLHDHPYAVEMAPESKKGFVSVVYQPYKEVDGRITGVVALCHDTTLQVMNHSQLGAEKATLQSALDLADMAMFRHDFVTDLTSYNEKVKEWFGMDSLAVPRDELFKKIHPDDVAQILKNRENARQAGADSRYDTTYRIIDDRGETVRYLRSIGRAVTINNEPSALVGTLQDVSSMVRAQERVRASESMLRSLVESAPFPIGVYMGREMRIQLANKSIIDVWGKGDDVIGKLYTEILPELDNQQIFDQLQQVYNTGQPFHARHQYLELLVEGKLQSFYFNYSFTPLFDANGQVYGVMNTAADVTDLNKVKKNLEEKEEELRNIFEQAPVAMVLMKGKELRLEIVNSRALELWGKEASEVLGLPIYEAVPRTLNYRSIFEQVYEEGVTKFTYGTPITVKSPFGERELFVNLVFQPYRELDGSIAGIMTMASDVTEEILARRKVDEVVKELSYFKFFADNGTDFIGICDMDGRPFYVNESGCAKLGIDPSEVTNTRLTDYFFPEDIDSLMNEFIPGVIKNGNGEVEVRFRHFQTKQALWMLYNVILLRDGNGEPYALATISKDITAQKMFRGELESLVKERTTELEEKNRELEQINKELEQFSYAASHDMQEPLRKVHTFSSYLLENYGGQFDERANSFLQKIGSSVSRMKSIIDDLLNYSQQTRKEQQFQLTNLDTIVANIQTDLELELQEKSATVIKDKLPSLQAVSLQMHQLFFNLFSNALKFAKPGVPVEIHIESERYLATPNDKQLSPGMEYHKIIFRDNGIGFDQQYAQQIFRLFTRLHSKNEYEGTGIGLGLCKKIMQYHNGDIWARGVKEEGATFYILLPVTQPAATVPTVN